MKNPFNFFKRNHNEPILENPNKELGDNLVDYYRKNTDMFQQYFQSGTSSDRRSLIKNIYQDLNYSSQAMDEKPASTCCSVYRGIQGDSHEQIKERAESFATGEIFFGGNAALHGMGIYTTTNEETAKKYATGHDGYGAVIKCDMCFDSKIIQENDLIEMRDSTVEYMKNNYKDQDVQQYAEFLETDNAAFAAMAGYDAVNIPDKGYTVVMNRSSLFVNELEYYHTQGQSIEKLESINQKQTDHDVSLDELDHSVSNDLAPQNIDLQKLDQTGIDHADPQTQDNNLDLNQLEQAAPQSYNDLGQTQDVAQDVGQTFESPALDR